DSDQEPEEVAASATPPATESRPRRAGANYTPKTMTSKKASTNARRKGRASTRASAAKKDASSSEDEGPAPTPAARKKAIPASKAKGKQPATSKESDDEAGNDDEDEDDEPAPKKKAATPASSKAKGKQPSSARKAPSKVIYISDDGVESNKEPSSESSDASVFEGSAKSSSASSSSGDDSDAEEGGALKPKARPPLPLQIPGMSFADMAAIQFAMEEDAAMLDVVAVNAVAVASSSTAPVTLAAEPPVSPKAAKKRAAPTTRSAAKKKPAKKRGKKGDDNKADDDKDAMRVDLDASDDDDEEDEGGDADADGDGDGATADAAPASRRRARAPRAKQPKKSAKVKLLVQWGTNGAQELFLETHPELVTIWDNMKEEKEQRPEIPEKCEQPDGITLSLLPFQREGVFWLKSQETTKFNGGILADEMGMGKTIQLLSLLVSTPGVKPNLILTPTVAILQWYAEIKQRTSPGLLSVCLHHGTNREISPKKLASYDIVLSTYALVESGFRRQHTGFQRKGVLTREASILHAVQWGRVVLDEAHAIKDRTCLTARAVFKLNCRYKWSLTGTPLQNRVGELYSLIRFLDADPFSYYFCKKCPCKSASWNFTDRKHCDQCGHISHQHFCWWNQEILKPIQKYGGTGDGLVAFQKLGLLLDNIMLRRTKIERADDLGLPPRIITVRRDLFNEAEEELYESLYAESARQFSTYVNANTVLNNYASIFSLLSRMRLASNHPDLVTTKLAIQANQAKETIVCGICQDEAEDPIQAKCKHTFCREDIRQYMLSAPEDKASCPVCFRPMVIDLSQPEFEGKAGKDKEKFSIVNYIDMSKWRSSTKIEALVEELTALQKEDSTLKSIVFSQFVAFLDLIHWRLTRAGFSCVKLDGRMTPQGRDTVIKSFMQDPAVTVFLVSLKAGGVALNLTEASRVFILDPWWNPAVEDQAFDRIHRLGQTRPIKITRLIIENSIESRILQLQEKKKMLFQSTVGKDMDALAKLSEEDLQFLFVL
ncbi:DNA repair protein rad16, partial [Irineochytrium annulatum]